MAARKGMDYFPAKEDDWSIAAPMKAGGRQSKTDFRASAATL
jgi:hypothetical protein